MRVPPRQLAPHSHFPNPPAPQWPHGMAPGHRAGPAARRDAVPCRAAGTRARRAEARSRRAGGPDRSTSTPARARPKPGSSVCAPRPTAPAGRSRSRSMLRSRAERRPGSPDRTRRPAGRPAGTLVRMASRPLAARSSPHLTVVADADDSTAARPQPGRARPAEGAEDGAMMIMPRSRHGCCRSRSSRWRVCWA